MHPGLSSIGASALVLLLTVATVGLASAQEEAEAATEEEESKPLLESAFEAITKGKPIIDLRVRWENAKADNLQTSNSLTGRARLGYQTHPFFGVSSLLEFSATGSPMEGKYFDGVEGNTSNQTIVADPDTIGVNRYWMQFGQNQEELLGSSVKVGRQRIKLDDDRFIGNVGWRQQEQTFDAVRGRTTLGVEDLLIEYAYLWEVNRIFGDDGPPNRRDFGQSSHLVHVSYDFGKAADVSAFAYLIDANDPFAGAAGSNTYGFRATGGFDFNDTLGAGYQASYAYQTDGGDNPTDYDVHYLMLEGTLKVKPVGSIGVGYEMLGTDDGKQQLLTPFSTAHKFNGFADVFLNNGGPRGLRDFFVTVAPKMPFKKWKAKFIFHQFNDDQGGDNLGQEYNIVTSYKLWDYVTLLYKFAYYDEGGSRSPQQTTRNILQIDFKY